MCIEETYRKSLGQMPLQFLILMSGYSFLCQQKCLRFHKRSSCGGRTACTAKHVVRYRDRDRISVLPEKRKQFHDHRELNECCGAARRQPGDKRDRFTYRKVLHRKD